MVGALTGESVISSEAPREADSPKSEYSSSPSSGLLPGTNLCTRRTICAAEHAPTP